MANFSPARAAAAAIALLSSAPSDRVVWMWNAPRTVVDSPFGTALVETGAGGPVAKTKTAARTAAVRKMNARRFGRRPGDETGTATVFRGKGDRPLFRCPRRREGR